MKRIDFLKSNGILLSGFILPIDFLKFLSEDDPIEIRTIKDGVTYSLPYSLYNQRTKDKITSFQGLLSLNDYLQEHRNDRNTSRTFETAREIVFNNYELDKNSWKELTALFLIDTPDLYTMGETEKGIAQGLLFFVGAGSSIISPPSALTLSVVTGIANQAIENKWPFNTIDKGLKTGDDYFDTVFNRAGAIVMNKLLTNDDFVTNSLLEDKQFRNSIGLPLTRDNNDIIKVTPPGFQKPVANFLNVLSSKAKDDKISQKDFNEAITSLKNDLLKSIKSEFETLQKKQEFLNNLLESEYQKQAKLIAFQKDLNYKVQEAKGLIDIATTIIGISDPQTAAKIKAVLTSALNIANAGVLLSAGIIGPFAFGGILLSSLFNIFSSEGQEIANQISEIKSLLLEVQNNIRNLIIEVANRIEKKLDVIYRLDIEIYKLLKEFAEKSLANDAKILEEISELNKKIEAVIQTQIQDSRKKSITEFRTTLDTIPVNLKISNQEYEKNLIVVASKCSDAYLSFFNGNLDGTKETSNWKKINENMESLGELSYSFGLLESLGTSLNVSTGKLPNPDTWFDRCYGYLEGRILNINYTSTGLSNKTKELYNDTIRIQNAISNLTKKEKYKQLVDERKKILGITELSFDKESNFVKEIKKVIEESQKELILATKVTIADTNQVSFTRGKYIVDNVLNGNSQIYSLEENFDLFDTLIQKQILRKYDYEAPSSNGEYGTVKGYRLCLNDEKYKGLFYPFNGVMDNKTPNKDGCVAFVYEYTLTKQSPPLPYLIRRVENGIKYDKNITFQEGSIVYYIQQDMKEFGIIKTLLDDINRNNLSSLKQNMAKSVSEKISASKLLTSLIDRLNSNSIKIRIFFSLLSLKRMNFLSYAQFETKVRDYPLPLSSIDSANNLFSKTIESFFKQNNDIANIPEISDLLVKNISDSVLLEIKYIIDNFENIYTDIIEESSIGIIDYLVSVFRGYIYVNKGYA